ncbi:MAG: tetratricopeptide repeat protein [Deltaproteobacteria bacterium]|nr:tetratricopeptide repeat protein [Deltaproteobacteria bacterium]
MNTSIRPFFRHFGRQILRPVLRFTATAALLLAFPAFAEELEPLDPDDALEITVTVEADLEELRRDLDFVAQKYKEPLSAGEGEGSRIDRRLKEGEVAYLLEDYLRAAIILLDVADDPASQASPHYDASIYFLADSLRRTQNYSGARHYFEDLLTRSKGDRLKDVVLALLEIANATHRYDGVEGYIARLAEAGGLARPEVDYIHAKTLFRGANGDRARLEEAMTLFRRIPADSAVGQRAAYFVGVALVSIGDLEGAAGMFEEAKKRATQAPESAIVTDLAHLALGRIHQDKGELDKAIASYQLVSQQSKHYSEVLFETAWAHVKTASKEADEAKKREQLDVALKTTELLMAAGPDVRLFPEARVLEGNLRIRLGATDQAYETFQSIVDRYGGARDKLAEIIAGNPQPKQFFEQIVATDLKTVETTAFLPTIAIEWAQKEPGILRAAQVVKDIREAEQYRKDIEEILKTLTEALAGERRYTMFKSLGSARSKVYGIQNKVTLIEQRLLTIERRLLLPYLDEKETASLDAAYAKRRSLEPEVESLPSSADQMAEAGDRIRRGYSDLDARVFRQTYRLSGVRAQLVAAEVWLGQNREKLSEKEVSLASKRIGDTRARIAKAEVEVDALGSDVRTAKAAYDEDQGRARATSVRESYAALTAEEKESLKAYRNKAPGDVQEVLAKIDGYRQTLSEVTSKLADLQKGVDVNVDDHVAEIMKTLEGERVRLDEYAKEETKLSSETDELLGPVATEALRNVSGQFADIVQKADVGVIDVAWARKQASSKKVGALVQKQQQEIEAAESAASGGSAP